MKMYTTLMTAHGVSAGINYKFGGTIANTLQAHRVIQYFQAHPPTASTSGPDVADKLVTSLYRQYFEEERHPSNHETLLQACKDAGIGDEEAKKIVEDQESGEDELKDAIREQKGNGVDAVPFVLVEGKRRDFTFEGAKEVGDYVKGLLQVVKESN